MPKRILSITLAIIFSLSVCCVSYAETTWDKEVESKAMVLKGIGVVNMDEDGNWSAFRNMSKSAFINFLCNLLDESCSFTEVYSEDAIRMAEDAGIIHANQDDLNKPLYYDEAMTMLVRLLGYELHAQTGGGFPHGYTSIANRLGLSEGIAAASGERFREYDAINLLYNAINCPSVEIISISDEGFVYGNTSDKTFLHEYRHIYRVEGVVDATETAALRSNVSVAENQIIIDGYLYQTEEDFSHILGMNAEAYVKDNKDGLDTVLYVIPRLNEELEIQADDILNVSVVGNKIDEIEYIDKNDNDKKAKLAATVAVVKNGQPLKGYTETDFEIADGTIRLIDNGGDNRYDVAIITSYKTMVVNRVSMMNETIDNLYTYDESNRTLNVKEENDSIIKLLDVDGNQVELMNIAGGNVLKIAESTVNGRKMVVAYVSTLKIAGTVASIYEKDDTYITVGGVEYTLSETYEAALSATPRDPKALTLKPGGVYEFYLDSDGEIAYAVEKNEGMQYGIVLAKGSDGIFNKKCYLKLFTTEGEWKELTFAEKIVFNDSYGATHKGYRPNDTMLTQIKAGTNNETGVIAYTTNDAGEINRLDIATTYIDGTEDKFNVKEQPLDASTGEPKQIAYRGNNRSFDSDVYVEDDAVMWMVDANNKNLEESYALITTADLAGDSNYAVSAYSVDEFGFADLLVVNDKGGGYSMFINNGGLFVVESIGEALAPNGEVVGTITGATGKYDSVTYFCEDETILNQLSFGDVTTVYVDKKGFVIQIATPYRKFTKDVVYACPSSMHGRPVILQGVVEYNDPTNLRIKIDCGPNTDDSRALRLDPGSVVFIVDTEDEKITRGTINDIEVGDKIMTKIVMSGIWGAYVVFR